ncbi:hypothetical protein BDB00DRAFT_880657 [Zychaea mexicana]|uniref:uncharacterized protein n=1 Tax=Zychaea mexicana TaxID=64656 RepID=UPI0022FDB3BC|nr:uncharacterized protein BDB00DRAFT_880657 [Zychaea mexicana]KAI9466424.1 hypothetical protein BDB00DRAFT_880657 [Zychaea mexicana]
MGHEGGHHRRDCTKLHNQTTTCFDCGQLGHVARVFPYKSEGKGKDAQPNKKSCKTPLLKGSKKEGKQLAASGTCNNAGSIPQSDEQQSHPAETTTNTATSSDEQTTNYDEQTNPDGQRTSSDDKTDSDDKTGTDEKTTSECNDERRCNDDGWRTSATTPSSIAPLSATTLSATQARPANGQETSSDDVDGNIAMSAAVTAIVSAHTQTEHAVQRVDSPTTASAADDSQDLEAYFQALPMSLTARNSLQNMSSTKRGAVRKACDDKLKTPISANLIHKPRRSTHDLKHSQKICDNIATGQSIARGDGSNPTFDTQ